MSTQKLCVDHSYLHGGEPCLLVDSDECAVCMGQPSQTRPAAAGEQR